MPPIVVQSNPNLGNVQPVTLAEAANRIGVSEWQATGYTGAGYKIGVLDRGFGGLTAFEGRADRPVTVALNGDKAAYAMNPITHGTQVLEVLDSIAPGAELIACEYGDLNRFIGCIDWMQRYGVNIINHSAGVPALPLNGQGRWAQEVDRALNANILWVNSAGNFAQGYYAERLTDRNLNRLHEFGGFAGEVEMLGVAGIDGAAQGVVMLSWEGSAGRPANAIDIDLQILNTDTGQVITGSYNPQQGIPGQEPLEYLRLDMRQDFAVQIIDANGDAAGVNFALFVEFAGVPGGQLLSSIIAPGDSDAALTVGALQGFDVAPYSSRGPLQTGALGIDLVAPGEVLLADGSRFVGTSVAAPVVAGTAALLWQAEPGLTAEQVREQLLTFTVSGGDVNFGQGRLLLPFPGGPPPPTQVAAVPTATPDMVGTAVAATIQAQMSAVPPTATTAPTEVAAVPERGTSLANPVTRNADWTPVERDFDGVTMVLVPAGCFMMGSENGHSDEMPVHEQCFDAPFWIDKYEVTQADFTRLGGVQADPPDFSGENRPVEDITWFEARDFCERRGTRLPTEREWEYAARGPDNLVYPWGNDFVGENVIWNRSSSQGTADVGSVEAGKSWVGAYDMSGNVWEWVSSLYADYPYDEDHESNTNDNSARVLRGGGWVGDAGFLRSASRDFLTPDYTLNFDGFRCARLN